MAAPDDARLAALARRTGRRCLQEGLLLATAESCTGGLIAKSLTDVAGSSAWFERGFVTYSNRSKHEQLGVPVRLIERHGAVSDPVALAMARGALRRSPAGLAVAVTGIAGPDGGSPGKPVGTVWIAWARRRGRRIELRARRFRFQGSRDEVRRRSAAAALRGLWDERH
jgi:nicotinamide-nucleotide amidase